MQKKFIKISHYLFLLGLCGLIVACSGNKSDRKVITPTTEAGGSDAGGRATVEAAEGGPGFEKLAESLGWETNTNPAVFGDDNAKKGGEITMALQEFPPTYRYVGKDSRLQVLNIINSLIYESLVNVDPKTLKYTPSLASHWKISDDKMTFEFRIDPNAKWSDGKPVIANDVVASWKLRVDEGIQDPSTNGTYSENYEQPVAVNDYVVRVKCKKANWRSFLYFGSSMLIFPAHHLDKVDGAGYLEKYQYQMTPSTGAYVLNQQKTKQGEKLTLSRRADYWAKDYVVNKGTSNFDDINFIFVLDERLRLEKFKKGEFDLYLINRAQWWAEEFTGDKNEDIKRGLIQKAKIFNFNPKGTSGFAFNTLEKPFDDIKVRKAFGMLWNIPQLNEKLFYNEYEQCVSYFQGSVYQNKNNPVPTYNPEEAVKLLAEAGWKKKSGAKWLTNAKGEPFDVDLEIHQSSNRVFTPLQQDLEQVGIKLNLVNITPQARFEKIMKRQFKLSYQNWTGLTFPNPESSMHSKYAEQLETNNITGMKESEIDKLCEQYDKSFDIEERIKLLRKIDSIAVAGNYYAFGWVAPYTVRAAYWNKFKMPKWGLSYSGDFETILNLWWFDKDKADKIVKGKEDKSVKLPMEKVEIDYWNRQGKPNVNP